MPRKKTVKSKRNKTEQDDRILLSTLRKRDVIAIVCSDIHARSTCPPARAGESDWFVAMRRPLNQLSVISYTLDAPILIAGDIFDSWKSTPELINFMLEYLPKCYAIPGQHDLPHHNYDDIKKSAYWTLVKAGVIYNIAPGEPYHLKNLTVCGFPWGMGITELEPKEEGEKTVALIHEYCWKKEHSYPGAPKENKLGVYKKQLMGYDFAVFGDNHLGFLASSGDCSVMNCGAFMRTKADQEEYKPMIGLLMADGSIIPYHLDTSTDVFSRPDASLAGEFAQTKKEALLFIEELKTLGDNEFSFEQKLRERKQGIPTSVYKLIKQIIQDHKTENVK